MLEDKRVFISGGAGVIGAALVAKLHRLGARMFVGDLKPRPENWPGDILYRQGDLNYISTEEIDNFDPEYFFHLAATFERSVETYDFWEENFHHNIEMSHHLMSCLKDSKTLKKALFASSYLIYDPELYIFKEPSNKPVVLSESDSINPRNLCGAAKLYHEAELKFLSSFGVSFESVSARIFRSYGKNSREIISRWIRSLLDDETLQAYREEGIFDYIYAEEVAEGLIRLMLSSATGVVNLGTGRSRSVREVLECLKGLFPTMKMAHLESDIPYEASQAGIDTLERLTNWTPCQQLEQAIPEIVRFEKSNQLRNAHKNDVINVLVSSVSKKVPLLNAIRNASLKLGNAGKIYGADVNENVVGRYFVDHFWQMPQLDLLTIEQLIDYCKSHDINCIIPTRDGELPYYSNNKNLIANEGISVMISDPLCVSTCLDKMKFYETVNSLGFPAIRTSEDINQIEEGTFVVKDRYGAGSRNIGLKLTLEDALVHAAKLTNPIFQPYVAGSEASVDVYVDKKGKVKGAVGRWRQLVVDGESQVTTTVTDLRLQQLCSDLAEALHIYGHAVFQAIVTENKEYQIIECNNRFGGASTLSLAAGLDSFYWFLLESSGQDIDDYPFYRSPQEKIQVRFPQDMVFTSPIV